MRGLKFHEYITSKVKEKFTEPDSVVRTEYPIQLPNGQFNFADIYVELAGISLIIEIETTLRNLITNINKAAETGIPLWIIVPNRDLRDAAYRKLMRNRSEILNFPDIMLISEIEGQKRNFFPQTA